MKSKTFRILTKLTVERMSTSRKLAQSSDFMSAMEPFVDWKNQMGIPCEMVDVSTTGGTASSIQSYIQDYYDTHDLAVSLLSSDNAWSVSLAGRNITDEYYTVFDTFRVGTGGVAVTGNGGPVPGRPLGAALCKRDSDIPWTIEARAWEALDPG